MVSRAPRPSRSVLPHLLALPRGAVVGLAPELEGAHPTLPLELTAFGPSAVTAPELRHAACRAPARLVLHVDASPLPVLGAALASLRRAGAVVVLRSADLGRLLEECDRILTSAGDEMAWVATADFRARRCLTLRVTGDAAWLRVPLSGEPGAEAVLARFAARGLRVGESRIVYAPPRAR